MGEPKARARWWRAPWLWLFLLVFYLLSPRMATMVLFGEVKPRVYRAQVQDIVSASFTDSGNVRACLSLDPTSTGKTSLFQVEVPLARLVAPEHPRVLERTTNPIGRGDRLIFEVKEEELTPGCADASRPGDVYTGVDEKFGGDHGTPAMSEYRGEMYVGDNPAYFYYLSREPLWQVRYQGQGNEVAEEHDIWFVFPEHRTSVRWWNLAWMPLAVLVDAVTGPFGWIAVVKRHG
jgi:hypothetical protein